MKHLTKPELEATHRIFTNVNSVIGGYYGNKVRDETKKFASRNRWIMLPAYNIESLREGAGMPIPNVYIHTGDEITDNGNGRAEGWMGVTYGNSSSMLWLRDILKRTQKAQSFIDMIKGMGSEWNVSTYHKIHTHYWQHTPFYERGNPVQADLATIDALKQSIENSDNSKRKPGTFLDNGDEVISCVTTFAVEAETTPEDFDQDIRDAFNLFAKLLGM